MSGGVGVVIVNYRTAGLAIDCLRSLAPEIAANPGARAVVVDNASGDRSANLIAGAIEGEGWAGWATLLPLDANGGFAAGNNAGIRLLRRAGPPVDWFLLLNPDTRALPGALSAAIELARARPRAGIVGSRLEHPDGTPQRSAFRFHSVLSELDRGARLGLVSRLLSRRAVVLPQPQEPCRVEWVSGAAMFVRRELLDEIGPLDERYFLYYEETDLCLRAARAGWQCWHEPRSRVIHLFGSSTGFDPSDVATRLPPYVFESRRRFFVKNYGRAYAALADLAWLSGHLAYRARMRLLGRPVRVAPGLLTDFLRQSALLGRP